MFGNKDKKHAEKELATWLAHPQEFGTPPKSVKYKQKYKVKMMGESTAIHLLDYVIPDGTPLNLYSPRTTSSQLIT